jgi:hypothetical protein
MKLVQNVLGLTLLGAVAFAGFAALIVYREGRPIHPPPEVQQPQEKDAQRSLHTLMTGLHLSAATARLSFQHGKCSEAVHALDAAMRVAEVG